MKKVFGFLALALAFVACSPLNETPIQPSENEVAEGITITAQLAPKDALTKAITQNGDKITSTWAVNEHIAILYEKDGVKKVADATIKSVSGSGTATFQFTVDNDTPDNTPCTIVYPLSAAKDDHSGMKNAHDILAVQDGTLKAELDVRVGEGTIHTETPSLNITTQPEPQFAVFKFTTSRVLSNSLVKIQWLHVETSQIYTIQPAAPASTVYAFLPPEKNSNVVFNARGEDDIFYTRTRKGVQYAAGQFYQSNIKMYKTDGINEGLAAFETVDEYDQHLTTFNNGTIKITGTKEAESHGLLIAKGEKITIQSLNDQIITRVDFRCGWQPAWRSAYLTSSTAGTVHWENETEWGSVEGINTTSFELSNSGDAWVLLDYISVYYLPAPADEAYNTGTPAKTLYEGTHFRITGTATTESAYEGKYGLRIDNHLNEHHSITIESKNGEIITKVRLRCLYSPALGPSTSSTAGTVRWNSGDQFGYIDGVNATSLTITNSTEYLFPIDHLLVYYYAE